MKKVKWTKKTMIIAVIVCLSVIGVSGLAINYMKEQKVIENNGYYEDSGKFDKEMTPVANMLLLLKVLNGSNYCDDDWYMEVMEVQGILQKQVESNNMNRDPYISKMMDLQTKIIRNLRAFTSSAWLPQLSKYDINELQKSYDAYHDYYYQNYPEGEVL